MAALKNANCVDYIDFAALSLRQICALATLCPGNFVPWQLCALATLRLGVFARDFSTLLAAENVSIF
jgi:hypothetical protein